MRPRAPSFLRTNVLILVVSNGANALNYATSLVLGRALTPEDFGVFNAVASLGLIFLAMTPSLPLVVSKLLIERREAPAAQAGMARTLAKVILGLAAVSAAVYLACAPAIARFLKLESALPVIVFSAGVLTSIPYIGLHGYLIGTFNYVRANTAGLGHAAVRLLVVACCVGLLHLSYNAALAAFVVANVSMSFWMLVQLRRLGALRHAEATPPTRRELGGAARFALPVLLNSAAVAVASNLDVTFAKHLFLPVESGLYAAAAVIAKIGFFLPLMVSSSLFPEAAKAQKDPVASLKLAVSALAAALAINGAFAGFVALFGKELLLASLGSAYAEASRLLVPLTLAMSSLALVSVLASSLLARSSFGFLAPYLVGLAGLGLYMQRWMPRTLDAMAASMLVWSASILAVVLLWSVWPGCVALVRRSRLSRASGTP